MSSPKLSRRDALAGSLSVAAAAAIPSRASADDAGEGRRFACYQVGDQQGLDSLRRAQATIRPPGPGEVRVAVRAAALNHRDLLVLHGRYGGRQPEERIPLGDGAGEVVAVGDNVTEVAPGDRVTAPHFIRWLDGDYAPSVFAHDLGVTAHGWLAEFITLPASALVRLPQEMSYAEAAALGAAGITAWAVVHTLGGVRPGDTVLTLGTGGVAILALQIAKMSGARVAITSSSDDKLSIARELGADITVNYRQQPRWQQAVRERTGERGVDIVVETVGLGTLSQSLACCASNARIGLLGALDQGGDRPPNLSPLYFGNLVLKGITSGSRRMLGDLLGACAANAMRPHIDRTFSFDEAREALGYLDAGNHVGKVVITDFG
jgi:NADPH:quinone reductase-like Zn-dependent oxidoreductase